MRVAKPLKPDIIQNKVPYIDPALKQFLDERAMAFGDLQDVKWKQKARRELNGLEAHDLIMRLMDRGKYR